MKTNCIIKLEIIFKNLISEYKLYDCLQIGLTNGIYAYYILKNPNTNLLSIDPNQNSKWENKGIELLKKFEMQNKYTFSNKNYYEILPSYCKKKKLQNIILY